MYFVGKMSADDSLVKYTTELYKMLPMKDPCFQAMLEQYTLFPGNTKEIIESKGNNAEKAEYFIQHVVRISPDLYLPKLIQAVEQYCKGYINNALQNLIDDMMADIDGMLTISYAQKLL